MFKKELFLIEMTASARHVILCVRVSIVVQNQKSDQHAQPQIYSILLSRGCFVTRDGKLECTYNATLS